ncbi:MAG: dihydroorotase [Thermoleophilia bacterium]
MTVRTWCRGGAGADLLIRGARAVDPLAGLDQVVDVLLRKGRIAEIGDGLAAPVRTRVVEGEGKLLLPGFVDLHTHLRTPGREDEEDLTTASAAAAAGGYVAVFGMANTDPVVDAAPVLEGLARQAGAEATVPTGFFAAMSKGLAGTQLTEMHELAAAGAVGFSDDGVPVRSAQLLRRALQYAKVTDRFVAVHPQDDSLMGTGVMHEGAISAKLGLGGIPAIAESADVGRALEVARYEHGRLHLCHLSTALALEHLARARDLGVPVTAEATPHHLTMTDDLVTALDANLKMNPPLRPETDRRALVEALESGLVDCVATDHAPHAQQEKEVPFEAAAFGTTGLETAFAALYGALVVPGELALGVLVTRMSQAPALIAGLPVPTIAVGEQADLCLVDGAARWVVEAAALHSRSTNSAWLGRTLQGRVTLTVAAGRVAFDDRA